MWWPDHQQSYLQNQTQESNDQEAQQEIHHHQQNQQGSSPQEQPPFRNSPLFHGYKMPPPFHAPQTAPSPSYIPHNQGHQWWYGGGTVDTHASNMQIPPTHAPLDCRGNKMSRKSETKPRGRMTAYAFFVQICREEHKKKFPNENVVFAEFSKKCAERWKTMNEKEKKRFHDMAEKDKKRYETEMKDYIPTDNDKKRGKKRKQIKDPNAPKRSLSAFFWFCNDERGKVKEAHPEYTVGDIAKELGRRWSVADSSIKSRYEEMADKDKARYDKEMTEYKKKGKVMSSSVPEVVKESEEEDDDADEQGEDE